MVGGTVRDLVRRREPNDLDLVIIYDNLAKIQAYSEERGFNFIRQLGRSKIIINEFPIHIIPETLNVIDNLSNLTVIDFGFIPVFT